MAPPTTIDIRNANELKRILRAVAQAHNVVVVDLSETTYCDCVGLGALVEGLHNARIAGSELRLVVGYPTLLRTRTLLGMTSLFSVYRTVPEALAGNPLRPPT